MKNKKGIILVELIFAIIIVSIITIFSMTILYTLYEKFSNDYKKEILKLDSLSTKIILENIFSNALNVNVSESKIEFYKKDTKLFDLGYYSKFVDLNSSDTNKYSIHSPNTKAQELLDYSITFDDENYYEIKNDSYNELINFEDTNPKEIKEQYSIISKNHTLECKDSKLYLDNNTLLENLTNCTFTISSKLLTIELEIDEGPIKWSFKL